MSENLNRPPSEKESREKDQKLLAEVKDFLDPLKKLDPEKREQAVREAARHEENKDILKMRTGGVTKEEDEKDPLKKHLALASAFLEIDPHNARRFTINFKGNNFAEYKVGAAELFPPNVQHMKVANEQGEVICERAFRGINPITNRVGYFDEEIFRTTGAFSYVPVYSGFTVEILDTQKLSDVDCQIRIREERERYFNPPPKRETVITRSHSIHENVAILKERILHGQEATTARNKLLEIIPHYVNVPREEFRTPDVDFGNLACAKVVTTLLYEAGFIEKVMNDVDGTIVQLRQLGWTISDDKAEPGDVVLWGPMVKGAKGSINDGGPDYEFGHKHIGIAIGPNTAVSNSSKDRMPRIGSIYTKRPVEFVLKPPV